MILCSSFGLPTSLPNPSPYPTRVTHYQTASDTHSIKKAFNNSNSHSTRSNQLKMISTRSALAALLLAQGIQAHGEKPEATVTLLQLLPAKVEVAASIISAAPTATAYAIACAKKTNRPECQALSGVTLTQGPSTVAFTMTRLVNMAAPPPPAPGMDPAQSEQEMGPPPPGSLTPIQEALNCQLQAGGGSVCVKKLSGVDMHGVDPQMAARISQAQQPQTQTLPPGALKFAPVPITAGLEKIKGQDADASTTAVSGTSSATLAGGAVVATTSGSNSTTTASASTSSAPKTTAAATTNSSSTTTHASTTTAASTTKANTTTSGEFPVFSRTT